LRRYITAGITSIYNKIGCNTPANRELLGDLGVNESNMLSYLGVIEQRANEVLQMYAVGRRPNQGLTLVHFSAQLELFLTQKHTLDTPNTPYYPLNTPETTPDCSPCHTESA